jgi:integrase
MYLPTEENTSYPSYEAAADDLYALYICVLELTERNPGQPLSVWTFQDIIKKVRKLVGAPALTPHKLRHLMLNDLLRAGMERHEVSYYAGHISPESLNPYLHPQREEVARHVRKATKWRDEQVKRLIEESKHHE